MLLVIGCSQHDDNFRLALLWGEISDTDILTADEFMRVDPKMRLTLMRNHTKLHIKPITEVIESAVMEYYLIPPVHRKEFNGKVNFGYVLIKPTGHDRGSWTNTQLWVKASALTEGNNICHNIDSDYPWTFYLSPNACAVDIFNICDETIPKLGLMYDKHYDLVLLSKTAEGTHFCGESR